MTRCKRAEQLHERVVDYLQKVSGTDDTNTPKALTAFGTYARTPVKYSADDIVSGILYEITRAFPQKAAYVGREALITLIKKSQKEALTAGFGSAKGQFLLVLLMYAFDHGCTKAPLYPWISQTLNDEKIINSTARPERLERKAVTWLNHVLAGYNQGANTRAKASIRHLQVQTKVELLPPAPKRAVPLNLSKCIGQPVKPCAAIPSV